MEASVAAAAAGSEGAPTGAAGAGEGTPDTGGLDLTPVLERFDGLQSNVERLQEMFTQQQAGEGEPAEGEEEFDAGGLFDLDNGMDPQEAQQLLAQLVDQRTSAALEKAIAPLMERVDGIQVGLDAEQLAAKYPALATKEGAEPVVNAARALAETLGNPALANNMQVLELIYKSQMADKHAAGERPAGADTQFELERAGGAGPAAGDEPNIAERIVASRKNTEFWSGW